MMIQCAACVCMHFFFNILLVVYHRIFYFVLGFGIYLLLRKVILFLFQDYGNNHPFECPAVKK